MHRIDNTTAVAQLPAPAPVGTPGYFTGGDLAGGVAPTIVDADWLNAVQEELIAIIDAGGITPNKAQTNQVLQALQAMFASPAYVNSFGLGGAAANVPGNNIDDPAIPTGFYYVIATTSGTKPTGDDGYGHLIVSREGGGATVRQLYLNNTDNRIWTRVWAPSQWSAWSEFYHSGNISTATSKLEFTQSGTGAVARTVQDKLRGWVTPEDFGAVGDGVHNDAPAIQLAFNSHSRVKFSSGKSYLMNSGVTVQANDVQVDFGNAMIINGGAGFTFSFGATADTPQNSGLKVTGGYFVQAEPATTSNLNYIRVAGFSNFIIAGCNMKNVSNGGIYIEAGCENGLIDGVTINGASGYSTNRGIWLNGSTASDWTSQLVDISSITRNATPVPVYAVKNMRITNCSVVLPAYGIYCMNTRDTHIENCYIDISGSGMRCIAVNNYSPGTIIKGNTLKGNQSSTGILVTQFSHDVIIEGNTFLGSFGGGRDIYVQDLADCQITNNKFNTNSTQQILIDMGATAVIRGNYFNRPAGVSANVRCVLLTTIDEAVAGTSTYGNTATTLAGITFANNVVKNRLSVVNVRATTAANGNIPGLDTVNVRDNIFYNFDLASGGDEYGLKITAPGTAYVIKYSYFNNTVYPAENAGRNRAEVTGGTGAVAIRTDVQLAAFRCTSPAGGGAITSTKLYGGYFSCGGATDAYNNHVTISPRTVNGVAGAAVATPLEIVAVNGVFASYDMTAVGTNYRVRFYDSAGAIINLATTAVTFDVVIAGSAT